MCIFDEMKKIYKAGQHSAAMRIFMNKFIKDFDRFEKYEEEYCKLCELQMEQFCIVRKLLQNEISKEDQ